MFEEITALHQQVRELVEKAEYGYKVTSIDSYGTTEYLHALTDIRFKVSAVSIADKHRKLSVEVRVASDGTLHIGDRLASY